MRSVVVMAWKTHEESDYTALQECVGTGFYAVIYATPGDDEECEFIYLSDDHSSAKLSYYDICQALIIARRFWGGKDLTGPDTVL